MKIQEQIEPLRGLADEYFDTGSRRDIERMLRKSADSLEQLYAVYEAFKSVRKTMAASGYLDIELPYEDADQDWKGFIEAFNAVEDE